MLRKLNVQDIQDILKGSSLLACGGGGSLKCSKLMLEFILLTMGKTEIECIDIEDIKSEDYLAVFCLDGFPNRKNSNSVISDFLNKFWSMINEAKDLISIDNYLGRAYDLAHNVTGAGELYPLPGETGPFAVFSSMIISAKKGIPIVNGDIAGRAIPSLNLSTLAAYGINPTPSILSSLTDNIYIKVYDNDYCKIEEAAKTVIGSNLFYLKDSDSYGGVLTPNPLQSIFIKDKIIGNTLIKCLQMGETIREAVQDKLNVVDKVVKDFHGYHICRGIIENAVPISVQGYYSNIITIKDDSGCCSYIKSVNENLIIWQGDESHIVRPLAMAPDLICYLTDEGDVLDNASIKDKQGTFVNIIGFKADDKLRNEAVVNRYREVLKSIGYDGPYIPIEELAVT